MSLIEERILRLEQFINNLFRSRNGIQVIPGKNILGQDTEIHGSLSIVSDNDTEDSHIVFRDETGDEILRIKATRNLNVNIGYFAGEHEISGAQNVFIGGSAGGNTTDGSNNTAIGHNSLYLNVDGDENTAVGSGALQQNTDGSGNTALGVSALGGIAVMGGGGGNNNVGIGNAAGKLREDLGEINDCSMSVFIGNDTKALGDNGENETVIGYGAVGKGSNTVVLGNDSVTDTHLKGIIHAGDDVVPVFVPCPTPLTSTAWDGDSFSTATLTTLDLSAVFGVPAGIKAAIVRLVARDSGSAASTDCYMWVGAGGLAFMAVKPQSFPNDTWVEQTSVIPCDANGDLDYVIHATGSGTMQVYLQILGYWK